MFAVAVNKIGQPTILAGEYGKVNPHDSPYICNFVHFESLKNEFNVASYIGPLRPQRRLGAVLRARVRCHQEAVGQRRQVAGGQRGGGESEGGPQGLREVARTRGGRQESLDSQCFHNLLASN